MHRFILFIWAIWPEIVLADPLDQGEAYTTRQGPPEWMDKTDFGLLIVDYGLFALLVVALGWLVFKHPQRFAAFEKIVQWPIRAVFSLATRVGGVGEFMLQMIGGLAAFILVVVWVFFCQWLKSKGLGALSMGGLALLALMLVRMIKGDEKPRPIS